MALAPGEARKDLSTDALFQVLRSHFGSLPDHHSGEVEIPLHDALMSAFAMFSLKTRPCWPSISAAATPTTTPHDLWDQSRPLRLPDAGHS